MHRMRSVIARGACVLFLGIIVEVATSGPTWAKTPPFSVDLSTTRPQSGEPVIVTVRFWADANHTVPTNLRGARTLANLLWAVPIDGDGDPTSNGVPVSVHRVGSARYRGTLTLTHAGSYALVPFSIEGGFVAPRGYPRPIPLEVVRTAPAAATFSKGGGDGRWTAAALTLVLVLVLGTGLAVSRFVRRQPRRRGE